MVGQSMNKLTTKQEKFCKSFIETGNASEAYRQSYDCQKMKGPTINRNAVALLDNSKIATRVGELQLNLQKKFEVTVESLSKELDEDRQLARSLGQPGAAISALNVKARIHGLDKQVMSNDPENPMPATIQVEILRNENN
jgi:phage terminase small subunit